MIGKMQILKYIARQFGNPPSDGVRVAMIEHNGAPIELIEFENNKS